jgi:pantoate--beta-alanine ligase
MGALHDGHLNLVRQAKAACGAVAVSIFVNPSQFNDPLDFEKYPRTLDEDCELLRHAGCDLVFAPNAREMYPQGFASKIEVGSVADPLEGAMRPGHFAGVATVVAKLLNIIQPTQALFGQKDAQQVAVIRRMVADLNLPVEIVAAATVREPDGLAMSSRNRLLTPDDRQAARVIYRALDAVLTARAGGETSGDALRAIMAKILSTEPKAQAEYTSIADPSSLQELDQIGSHGALASTAVRFGAVRLIDNIILP